MKKAVRILGLIMVSILALSIGGAIFLRTTDAAASTTIKQNLKTSDGNRYVFSVTYDKASGLPEKAELAISEIDDSDDYDDYVDRSVEEIGDDVKDVQFAKAFDITIVDPKTGKTYQPDKDVKVSIKLADDDVDEADRIDVVHFQEEGSSGDTPEVLDSNVKNDIVAFETDGFSVYVVVGYTVDFHYGENVFNLPGGDTMFLSELIDELEIKDFTLKDVKNVEFSDPDLVQVDKVIIAAEDDTDPDDIRNDIADKMEMTDQEIIEAIRSGNMKTGRTDWRLASLAPFDTEETLTITLRSGQKKEIIVTDERVPGTRVSNSRVTADGVTYNLQNNGTANGWARVYAYSNGCTIHDEISYNGHVYKVEYANAGLGYNTFTRYSDGIGMDADLIRRAAGAYIDLPAVKTDLTPAEKSQLESQGFVAGDNNDSQIYKIWKKAEYKADTNSVEYTMKYFQSMKKDVPLDFIFIYDDSISMYDGNRWAPKDTATDREVRIVEAQGTRIVILEAAKSLLSNAEGYDIRVAVGGASDGDKNTSRFFEQGEYNYLQEYLSIYHGGVTDHTVGVSNALKLAKQSKEIGRTPILIYMSDFVDGGSASVFRNTIIPMTNQIHEMGSAYALKTIGRGTNFRTDAIASGDDYVYFMNEISEGVEQLGLVINDAIGYYMKDKVTITDSLSDPLKNANVPAGSISGGSNAGSAPAGTGKSTWTIGGTSPYPGAGKIYTETFTVKLDDNAVYAGAMPTNDKATVTVGGKEKNKITPPTAADDSLHLRTNVRFIVGSLNKNDNTDNQKASNGAPLSAYRIAGATFVLKNSTGTTLQTVNSAEDGTFEIDYTNLQLGKTYTLEESSAPAGIKKPDKTWELKISETGIITSRVSGNARQTPEMTIATPSQFVIWNHIDINPTLIPITVQKTWDSSQTDHRDPVPFTVYGINRSTGAKTQMAAYDSDDIDTANRVRYIDPDDPAVTKTGDKWSRTVYVWDKDLDDENNKFYEFEGELDKSILTEKPEDTFKIDGVTLTVDNWDTLVNTKDHKYRYGQSYSYAIDEGDIVYPDGWYTPEFTNNANKGTVNVTTVSSSISDTNPGSPGKKGWYKYEGELSSTNKFQLNLDINRLRYNTSWLFPSVPNYVRYIGIDTTGINVASDRRDFTNNADNATVILHNDSTGEDFKTSFRASFNVTSGTATGYLLYQGIQLPASWSDELEESTYGTIKNISVKRLEFTSDRYPNDPVAVYAPSSEDPIYGEPSNLTLPNGPDASYATRLAIEKYGYNTGSHNTNVITNGTNPQVYLNIPPVDPSETDYYNNECILGIKNKWNDNELIETRIDKDWKDNDTGTPVDYAEDIYDVKQDIEYSIKGTIGTGTGATKKTVPIFESADAEWETGKTKGTIHLITSGDDANKDEAKWESTVYLPKYDTSTYDRAKDLVDPSTACEAYQYDNNSLTEKDLTIRGDDDGEPTGEWEKATAYKAESTRPTGELTWKEKDIHNTDTTVYLTFTYHFTGSSTRRIKAIRIMYYEPQGGNNRLQYTIINLKDDLVNGGEYYIPIHYSDDIQFANSNKYGNGKWGFAEEYRSGIEGSKNFREVVGGTQTWSLSSTVPREATKLDAMDYYSVWYIPDDEPAPQTFTATNTYTPYKEIQLKSDFTDLTEDKESTEVLKKVYYTIKDDSGKVVRTTDVNVVDTAPGDGNVTTRWGNKAYKSIYVKPGKYSIYQSYTLDEGDDAHKYVLDNSYDAYIVNYKETINGTDRTKNDAPFYNGGDGKSLAPAKQIKDNVTLLFTNIRKTLPIEVKMDWEPSLENGEDPLHDTGKKIDYKISFQKSDRTPVEIGTGSYKRKDSDTSPERNVEGEFELDLARQTNKHNTGAIPSYSVREAVTECSIDSEKAEEILPDYNLSIATQEKTDGSGNKYLSFTAVANIKRVPVIINKSWGERVEEADKNGVKLTYTVYRVKKNAAGKWVKEDIYGTTGTADSGIEMTMDMPDSDVPDVTMGKLLINNTDPDNEGANVVTKYYNKLDSKTKEYYSNTDVIYLPILRSSSKDQNVKYMLTEEAHTGILGLDIVEKKYYVSFRCDTGKEADNVEELNPRGKNVEEAGNPANAGLFRLNSTGNIIAVINGGNSWQNVAFMKIDSNGGPLNGAEFTMYDDKDFTVETVAVKDSVVESKSQEATVNGIWRPSYDGIVDYGEVPSGIYYLKETAAPSGFTAGRRFVAVVGREFMDIDVLRNEEADVFANITQADLDAQNDAQLRPSMTDAEKDEARKYYAIFELKNGKADPDSDIVNYGAMNSMTATRRVMLRKTNSVYTPLSDAEFTIYNYNMTKVTDTVASKSSGAFYIHELPYGTYYLKETAAPDGYGSNKDKFFRLVVSKGGASISRGVKNLVRQKYVVYTGEGSELSMYTATVDPDKKEYETFETVQLSIDVDGTELSTAQYGSKFKLSTFGGNVQFADDNRGITFFDSGDITLLIELKEDITVDDKTIKAGTAGIVTVKVVEPPKPDDDDQDEGGEGGGA